MSYHFVYRPHYLWPFGERFTADTARGVRRAYLGSWSNNVADPNNSARKPRPIASFPFWTGTGAKLMKIRPHTLKDLDRYGPLVVQPLPLSSPVWDVGDFTAADSAALQKHFRRQIAPLVEATCTDDPAFCEILRSACCLLH